MMILGHDGFFCKFQRRTRNNVVQYHQEHHQYMEVSMGRCESELAGHEALDKVLSMA